MRDRTAVFIRPGSWPSFQADTLQVEFTAYRLVGNPPCDSTDLPPGRTRSLPTDHIGKALRALLIENQDRQEDLWIFHSPHLLGFDGISPFPFRASLLSVAGVRSAEPPVPLLAPFHTGDLTILPWETLRYVDFEKLDWNPSEDYLLTYSRHVNRRGFSTYLTASEYAESRYEDFGDYLAESGILVQETRPFHRHHLLTELKRHPIRRKKNHSLLVDLSHIRNGYNGTMEYGRNLFKGILDVHEELGFGQVRAMGEPRHVEFHGISRTHLIDPKDDTLFDLVFRPYQIDNPRSFANLIFRGRRFVISQLDAIGSRCDYIYDSTMRFYQQLGMAASDGVVCISEYGLRDAMEFFAFDSTETPCRAILLGMEPVGEASGSVSFAETPEFMVIGSWRYDHKMLRPVLEAIREIDRKSPDTYRFHFLGDLSAEPDLPACVRYYGHNQKQEDLDTLFRSVSGFIFPSVYEGYGLPIMHAFRFGKPILLADTEVNHEIQNRFGGSQVFFYDAEKNLVDSIQEFLSLEPRENIPANPRDWKTVARETLAFLEECIQRAPNDPEPRRRAREALLLAAAQQAVYEQQEREKTGGPSSGVETPSRGMSETAAHPTTPEIPPTSILPRSLARAWIESRDRLPEPLVKVLRAIRKRIPDGT